MTGRNRFYGVMATPITPFKDDGELYEEGIANLVTFLGENGVKSLYCLGSYGAFPLMDRNERMRAAEIFIDEAKRLRMKVIINVSAQSTKEAVALASHANEKGADAISSLVPYYYSASTYTERNFIEYFKSVIRSVDLPLYFYNNPRSTGYSLKIGLFENLLDLGLGGMKEGTGDIGFWASVLDIVEKRNIEFEMIPGSVKQMLSGLAYGLQSIMSGVAVIFPEINVKMYEAFMDGDIHKAVELHRQVLRISRIQRSDISGYEACYGILRLRGVYVGKPRSPWLGFSEKSLDLIRRKFEEIQVL